MDDCFYEPLGAGRFRSTLHTTGPWDARSQHGGPPSALLARALEQHQPREDMAIGRVTVELLGAVPVAELTVQVRMRRPGRSVELLEASLSAGGRPVATATAWRVRRTEGVSVAPGFATPPGLPAQAPAGPDVTAQGWVDGYLSAVEWRFVRGEFGAPGPAAVWTRLRHPLVGGEQPSPLQRVMAVADSGNGVSSELDIRSWLFINPELTVHLVRPAQGEWVCLDATTAVADGGCGLATSVLSDQRGPVAVGAQSLLVAPR